MGVRRSLAPVDLPVSGQARFKVAEDPSRIAIFPAFSRGDHAGTNQTHFALQYVPQLRKLIQTALSEKCPETRDSGIVHQFEVDLKFAKQLRIAAYNFTGLNAHLPHLQRA